jgi:hypothetical protein
MPRKQARTALFFGFGIPLKTDRLSNEGDKVGIEKLTLKISHGRS